MRIRMLNAYAVIEFTRLEKDKNSDADPQIYTYQIGDQDVQNLGEEVQLPSWEPDQVSCSWARWHWPKI